jgi:hypothetical protein
MLTLPDAVLGHMRAMAESLMIDTCTLAVGSDAYGDMGELLSDQYTVVASDVVCRVINLGRRYTETVGHLAEREIIIEAYRLICPYDTALAVDQRVMLSDGSVFQIVDLNTARTDATDAQAVMVRIHG